MVIFLSPSSQDPDPFHISLNPENQKRNGFGFVDLFWIQMAIYVSLGPIKDVKATGEAFAHQKRTKSTSKMKFINFFYVCGLCFPFWIRIRIHNTV